jgi:hypothetical protein
MQGCVPFRLRLVMTTGFLLLRKTNSYYWAWAFWATVVDIAATTACCCWAVS